MGLFDKFKKGQTADATNGLYPDEPRDDFKPKAYYLEQLQRTDDFLAELAEVTSKEEGGRIRFCRTADQYLFRRICLLYVLKADKQDMRDEAVRYCSNTHERVQLDDEPTYNIVCRTLSFATLLGLDSAEIEFLEAPLPLQGLPEDAVSDLLRNALFKGQATTDKDFYYKDKGFHGDGVTDMGGLMKAINADSPEGRTSEFVKYLETVKEKHHQRLLKHYEKVGEQRYVYTGSYDFRLTAVAKVLGIDKDAVADSKFIAADLM